MVNSFHYIFGRSFSPQRFRVFCSPAQTPPEAATACGMDSYPSTSSFRVLKPRPADPYLLTLLLLFLPRGMPSLRAAVIALAKLWGGAESFKCPPAAVLSIICPVVTIAGCLPYSIPWEKQVQVFLPFKKNLCCPRHG